MCFSLNVHFFLLIFQARHFCAVHGPGSGACSKLYPSRYGRFLLDAGPRLREATLATLRHPQLKYQSRSKVYKQRFVLYQNVQRNYYCLVSPKGLQVLRLMP